MAQVQDPDYLNAHCEGGPDACPMKYFRDNQIDYISPGHYLTDPDTVAYQQKAMQARVQAKMRGEPINSLTQMRGDPIRGVPPTKEEAKEEAKKAEEEKKITHDQWMADNCVQNDGVGTSECPMKFENVNNVIRVNKNIKQALTQMNGEPKKEPKGDTKEEKDKEVKKGSDEYAAKNCEQNDGTGWAECPIKMQNANTVDFYHPAFITDPDVVAYPQAARKHSFAQKHHRERNLVQVAEIPEVPEEADKNCGSVNWAECPGYFREQNDVNAISGGHFVTDPKKYNVKRATPLDDTKPLDSSFIQLQAEQGDIIASPGHWWKSIQSMSKNKEDIDESFVQLGELETYDVRFYSDELANGDSADNRDIHEDEDMNDDVVDFNGATNAGYGSRNMEYFHAHNTIDESAGAGHYLTDPAFLALKKSNNL